MRFAVPFSKDSYSYSLWGRPGTPLLRTARSPQAQNPLIDTLTAPAHAFWIFFFKLSFTPSLISLIKSHLKEPREGKGRRPGCRRRFLWGWREEWKHSLSSLPQPLPSFGKCGQKVSMIPWFQGQRRRWRAGSRGGGRDGRCRSMPARCTARSFFLLGFFSSQRWHCVHFVYWASSVILMGCPYLVMDMPLTLSWGWVSWFLYVLFRFEKIVS